MADQVTKDLDEGLNVIKDGMKKITNILEEHIDQPIDGNLHMHIRYKSLVSDYICTTVLPALREKQGEFMLREFVRRWKIHNVMVPWMSSFFKYVDRFYISEHNLPSIEEVGLKTFIDLVYDELKINVRNAVITLIEPEREGELIERSLLKNAVGIFVEAGMGDMDYYVNDFEAPMLEASETYYSRKAALWITEYSCPGYCLKVEKCLHLEKDRVSNYLQASSEKKLLNGFIQKLFDMYDKYEHYVQERYQNNELFQKVLEEEFTKFCNEGYKEISIMELLSAFSDNMLKKDSSEKLNDNEIELALEKVVKILHYIIEKDIFAEFYRKKLARRLLSHRSAYVSNEQSMLAKLKQEIGIQYTRKMEGMVNDLTLSKDLQDKFVAYLNREDIHVGLDLSVTVLTSGLWPPYNTTNIDLPSELGRCIIAFNQFYCDEAKDRRLQWMFSLGTCTVEGRFIAKTIELVLSPYQASLLMLFNESERLSFDDIKSQLKLEDDDVTRVLYSLACSKYKVLLKEPNTKKISPTDYFVFNSEFTDNSKRIEIPLPHIDEKMKVKEERTLEIEAAIVHIMKRERELSFQKL
ncbi:cullin-1-like [Cryptomeria japonica]|uniref:cullin-1-like n=1 Tax=Cryptomeria japonica TaxID=3369 RepID=UPI0027DA2831|nr:cullin-1-like [Cryptomeria japonica]